MKSISIAFVPLLLALLCASVHSAEVVIDGKTMTPEEAQEYLKKKAAEKDAQKTGDDTGKDVQIKPANGDTKPTAHAGGSSGSSGSMSPPEAMKKPDEKKTEEKKTDNPFGVDLKGKDEKVLNPSPTEEELAAFKKYMRLEKDKSVKHEDREAYETVLHAFEERWGSGARTWTAADFDNRVKAMQQVATLADYVLYTAAQDCAKYVTLYVAHKDEDANAFVERVKAACRYHAVARATAAVEYRKIVNEFLEHEKFAKADANQKYLFVNNFLLPKIASKEGREAIQDLAKDLKEEAGLTNKK
ncbi:MAG: hypothetical protein HY291_23355 [Planctomycetes bacterium]|nr:hypothetical protein [Planctomycetota bacterium]